MKKIIAAIIIRFSYENLRNEAHVEFHTNVNALFVKYTPEALGIATIYPSYKARYDEEVEALDVIRRSELTAEIVGLDHERDRIWRGFADSVKAFRNHFDPDKRRAAEKVEVILEHYGNIAAKTIDEETAAIEDLHRELIKQDNYLYVAALGLGDWLGQLVQTSRNLEQLMMARYEEASKRPDIRVRSVRKELDKVFRTIVDLLEVQVRVNSADANKAFLAELNAVMERYKDLLAQEAGRRHPIKDLGAGDHTVIEPIDTQQYTGRPITIIPEVHYREEGKETKRLYLGEDFTITYKNNVEVGQAELTIHGKGNYKGEKSLSFHIAR
jgi:hypothetical protein